MRRSSGIASAEAGCNDKSSYDLVGPDTGFFPAGLRPHGPPSDLTRLRVAIGKVRVIWTMLAGS
ncbi:hypothetical protein [Streptomyces sp. NPDC001286]